MGNGSDPAEEGLWSVSPAPMVNTQQTQRYNLQQLPLKAGSDEQYVLVRTIF